MSFKDMEDRPNLAKYATNLQLLDRLAIDTAKKNSQSWFKKRYNNVDIVRELYTPIFKTHEKYPARMKVKVPMRDNEFTCEVFDAKGKELDINAVEMKGARVTAIIQCTGIWIAGPKFGMTWKLLQMVVVPPTSIKGFSFLTVEGDKIAGAPGEPAYVNESAHGAEPPVPDTDDDDDDLDDDRYAAHGADVDDVTDGADPGDNEAEHDELEPSASPRKRGRRA
jgi:hypothetical protein